MFLQGKTLVIRTILLIVYGFVGAAVFTLLEKREESNKTTSNRMLEELRKNFAEHQNISDKEFKVLAMAVYNAVRVGLSADWTYFRAVDFTYTVLTTIGYGHLTPVTTYGKLFCIVFCLFGIPVCLLTLKTAGELISRFLTCVVTRVESKVLKNKDVRHVEIKCTMLAVTVMALYLSLSAAVQVIWEKWSFLDAFYAWFVAFSTIGFGDYIPFDSVVPRKDKHGITAAIFHVVATFPALFGLAIVASVMNSVFVVFDKYRLHTAALNCHCSRRNRKRNSKDRVKLSFAKLDAVDDRSRGRSHSV